MFKGKMKYIISITLLLASLNVNANGSLNLSIPGAPGSYQSDRFRSGELDCSMAIGSGTNVEFGVVGVITNNQTITTNTIPTTKDVGVYGRIIIPIGAPKGRVDCNILYQLELEKKRIEIQKLESELRNLQNLKFEK
jgi:hypothetical protein